MPSLLPGCSLQFSSRIGFSNLTARRISSNVANSRSSASATQFAHKKSQRIYTSMHSAGRALTHETELVVVVVVAAVVLTLTRIIKSVVTGQAPVTLELRNTPGKNTNNPRWYTYISQLTQFMLPPETYKSEIGSQSTMCQVHTSAYPSHYPCLEKPTIPIATQERLPRIYYT